MVFKVSLKEVGENKIAPNFKFKEFRCKDGSDEILIDLNMVTILQRVRDHFGKSVNINSGYRTVEYNKKIGGSDKSYHCKGMAADIVVKGVDPLTVGLYVAEIMGETGGIEIGTTYCHIDTREKRWRAYTKTGGNNYITVTDFGTMLKRNF